MGAPAQRAAPRRFVLSVLVALTLTAAACGADDTGPGPSAGGNSTAPQATADAPTGPDVSTGDVPSTASPTTPRTPGVRLEEGSGPFAWRGDPKRDGSLNAARIRVRKVAALDEPTILIPRPGDDRLYAAERAGRVRSLTPDGDQLKVDDAMVLDITGDVTTEAERGLLGLAFSADGKVLYVSHTNAKGDSRVEFYAIGSDGRADPGSKQVLLAQDQPFANHNGGNVVLGPDGFLYFGLGDGGAGDDPENRAQNPDELLGKILRIDPAHPTKDRPYAIPAGNPYRSGGGRPEIYLSGARNPWRFSFDRSTGDLWVGDVGQDAVEEVDVLPKGTGAGRNLGWSGYEGSVTYLDGKGRRPKRSVPPVFEYRHSDGGCSITGGFVYRGRKIRALQGAYVFADYCAGHLRALRLGDDGTVADERELGVDVDQPISFAQDASGELYVLSQGGDVLRLEPR